jgi:hypothetical protein
MYPYKEFKGFQMALACERLNKEKRLSAAQVHLLYLKKFAPTKSSFKPVVTKKLAANTLYGTILN